MVRRSIGSPSQDAAIDPLMTGRELRLQSVLYGIPGTGRGALAELLERVGLTAAAGRRVGSTPACAAPPTCVAANEPEVLFSTSPTTSLGRPAASNLWEELRPSSTRSTAPPSSLTTQYLEEADQLRPRIAIIDGGPSSRRAEPLRPEGRRQAPTPAPRVRDDQDAAARPSPLRAERPDRTGVPPSASRAAGEMTAVVRLDEASVVVEHMELNAPTSTTFRGGHGPAPRGRRRRRPGRRARGLT